MKRATWRPAAIAAALLSAAAVESLGQGKVFEAAYVYPAGGRRGETVRVGVGGQGLINVKAAHVTGRGVRARVLETQPRPKREDLDATREELQRLAKRKTASVRPANPRWTPPRAAEPWTEQDESRLNELSERVARFGRFRDAPAVAERVELELAIAPDAPPGPRDLRLEGALGLSNPLVFLVGDLPEVSEPPLTARAVMSTVGEQRFARWRQFLPPAEPPPELALPTILNGQIGPGECDHFRFAARQGRKIVIAVTARELSPYLADAVPGWFDAVAVVFDAEGRELAAADHWRFHPDPVLCFEPPRDGMYTLRIHDCLYRGREDFVYRVTLGELPFITDVFPLGGPAGKETVLELSGWNLGATETRAPADLPPGIHPLERLVEPRGVAAGRAFAVDTLPECLEEPRARGGDQTVALPMIVNGRVSRPGESDAYRFAGRAGQEVVAEVMARRLGSPLDAALTLTDAEGTLLAFGDDQEDRGAGLVTHHADARISFRLPADGFYRVCLSDIQGKAGAAYAYRLRISEPRPDFALRLTPSALTLRRGTTAAFTAHAIRRDGFDGEIALSLEEAPRGFVLGGGVVPAGQDQVRVTLSVPADAETGPVDLTLRGAARINGQRVEHRAAPAEDRMQAFAWRFLVPVQRFTALVADGPPGRTALLAGNMPLVRLPVGAAVHVPLRLPPQAAGRGVSFELSDPPPGIEVIAAPGTDRRGGMALKATADAKPGQKGNLIVNLYAVNPGPARAAKGQPPKPAAAPRRRAIGTLPAIPYEIVAREP